MTEKGKERASERLDVPVAHYRIFQVPKIGADAALIGDESGWALSLPLSTRHQAGGRIENVGGGLKAEMNFFFNSFACS